MHVFVLFNFSPHPKVQYHHHRQTKKWVSTEAPDLKTKFKLNKKRKEKQKQKNTQKIYKKIKPHKTNKNVQ